MQRLSAVPGFIAVLCIFPVCSWWLLQVLVVLESGGPGIGAASLLAIEALLLLQLLSIGLFSAQWAQPCGVESQRANAVVRFAARLCTTIIPAWPALAVLWLASETSATELVLAEILALGAGLTVGLISYGLRLSGFSAQTMQQSRVFIGVAAVCAIWLGHNAYFSWLIT